MRKRPLLFAALVAALGFCYFSAYVGYGINFEDEGTLLYQIERTADGQTPYKDFHIGYTPAIYYVHAAVMRTFGYNIMPGRWLLVAVNAASLFFLTLLALRVAPPWLAWLPAVFYMVSIPVHPGAFAAFNIPYPVWYNVLFFCAGVLTLLRFAESGRLGWVVLAGLLAGVDFAFKPNAGLFQLAASSFAMLAVVPMGPESLHTLREKLAGIWWWMLWTGTLLATWGVFAGKIGTTEVEVLLLPVTVAALVCAWRSSVTPPTLTYPSIIGASLALIGSFVAINLPWMIIVHSQLGTQQFLVKVFFFGADFEKFYYLPYPVIGRTVVAGFVAAALAMTAPRVLAGTRLSPVRLAVLGLAGCALAVLVPQWRALMPQGFASAVTGEIELAMFALVVVVHWLALLVAMRSIGTSEDSAPNSARNIILVVGSVFMYLQLYPRTDYMHWITAAPLSMVLSAGLLAIVAERWSKGASLSGRMLIGAMWLAPIVLVMVVRAAPRLQAIAVNENGGFGRPPSVRLQAERAPVWMNAGRTERYSELAEVVRFVREHTAPDEQVFTFPALDIVSFLSDRHNPTRHGYFFPRWPGHDSEAEVVAYLMERKPRYAVVLHAHAPFFVNAPMYYYDLGRYLNTYYSPYATIGRYMVLRRRVASPQGEGIETVSVTPASMPVPRWLTDGLLSADAAVRVNTLTRADALMIERYQADVVRALSDPVQAVRDRAVWTLKHSQDPHIGGELTAAVREGLLSPREQVLAMRVAAGGVDAGGVRNLFVLAREGAGRIRGEAVSDLFFASARERASEYWPGRGQPPGHLGVVPSRGDYDRTLPAWIKDPIVDGNLRRAAIWASRDLPADKVRSVLDDESMHDDIRLRVLAAYESAARGLPSLSTGTALSMMAFGIPELEYMVPRLVQRVYDGSDEADWQFAEALRRGAPLVRRQAGWLAATVGGRRTVEAAAENLYDADPQLRMSALWAIHRRGELGYLDDIRHLQDDGDFEVRQFAERAVRHLKRLSALSAAAATATH